MADVPSVINYGKVVGRFVAFLADSADGSTIPDEIPLTGTVTLTPRVSVLQVPGATPPRMALAQTLVCPVVDGWLCPPGSTTPGVWVIATDQPGAEPSSVQWQADFSFPGNVTPGSVIFNVPISGGEVDLSLAVSATPAPGTVTVVSHEDALAAAASAAEAAATVGALGWAFAQDYGLDLTGATTHSAAQVQAWLDAGPAYAAGVLKCSETVVIKDDADLHMLTLNYTGSGTALQVGDPAAQLFRKTVQCPQVVAVNKATTGWTEVAGTVGVQVTNAYGCSVTFPRVVGFETGVKVTGVPIGGSIQGTQQCSFYPLHLDNNKINFLVAPFVGAGSSTSGWANQNSVFGGRMSHNSAEGTAVAGVKHVEIAACPNVVNGWTFYGTSLESPNVVEYHVDMWGQYNEFNRCRWENTGGDASRRVRSNGVAQYNVIRGGFNAGQITQVLASGGRPFDTDTDVQLARRGGNATVPTVLVENPFSSTAPVLTVMEAGAAAAGADPSTAWAVRATAQQWAGKRSGDAAARMIMDQLNGRIYVGDGTVAPVAYLTGQGAAMLVGGGALLAPLTTASQDLGSASFQWRDVRLSRGIGVHGSAPPTSKPAVTGSRGGNAALASLLTALASYGLVTDSSSA